MDDGSQPYVLRNAERQDRGRMAVADRHHVRTGLVDGRVDESLTVGSLRSSLDRLTCEIVLEKVSEFDQLRRAGSRQQESCRVIRMTNTDVPEGVENSLVREDSIRRDQVRCRLAWFNCHVRPRGPLSLEKVAPSIWAGNVVAHVSPDHRHNTASALLPKLRHRTEQLRRPSAGRCQIRLS